MPTLGICGGYQMFGGRIVDGVESGEGEVLGLGLLPVETVFGEEKVLGRPEGTAPSFGNVDVSGYEIRHGKVRGGGEPLFVANDTRGAEGCRIGETYGTSWHGVFESDGFRRAFLRHVAQTRSIDWTPGEEPFAAARETRLDALGDLVAENVDRDALLRLIDDGQPSGLPAVRLQVSGYRHQEQTTNGEAPAPEASPRTNGDATSTHTVTSAEPGGLHATLKPEA